jgi:hypothetical protein
MKAIRLGQRDLIESGMRRLKRYIFLALLALVVTTIYIALIHNRSHDSGKDRSTIETIEQVLREAPEQAGHS